MIGSINVVKDIEIYLTLEEIEDLGRITLEGSLIDWLDKQNKNLILDIKDSDRVGVLYGNNSCEITISEQHYNTLKNFNFFFFERHKYSVKLYGEKSPSERRKYLESLMEEHQ